MEDRIVIREGSGTGKLFIGLLIGALIGAGVAMLTAPRSGIETRSMIGQKGSDIKDRAVEIIDDTRSRAKETLSNVSDSTRNLISRNRELKRENAILEDEQSRSFPL